MFFLLYKHTDNRVFDDFPKISEDFSKLFRRPDERSQTFSENFRKFPKISEDCRRLQKTFGEDPKMFRWYTNEFKYNLRDKRDITEIIDIFTCEDIAPFLSICYHSLYHWLLYNNGNWIEWSAIWSEIIRVISKSNERAARVRFEITSMISDQNCTPLTSITTLLNPFWNRPNTGLGQFKYFNDA